MRNVVRSTMVTALVLGVGGVASGCSSNPVDPAATATFEVQTLAGEPPVLVMTQNGAELAHMDAHFSGVIQADEAGCLRIDEGEGPTVVWPVGYTGAMTADGVAIRNAGGAEVGLVGGEFTFGGGIVPELLASLGFTDADRAQAAALCPGSYWIVAG